MGRFILMTFVFLGWSFYELSDGADFEPELQRAQSDAPSLESKPASTPVVVATAHVTAPAPNTAPEPTAQIIPASLILPQTTTRIMPTLASLSGGVNTQVSAGNLSQESLPEAANASPEPQSPDVIPNDIRTDIRSVRGTRVNMRGGPGTSYSVLAKLTRGMEVQVLRTPGNGWVKLRVLESGRVGWMAESLVTVRVN